jgi:predicted Zn-dependent protease
MRCRTCWLLAAVGVCVGGGILLVVLCTSPDESPPEPVAVTVSPDSSGPSGGSPALVIPAAPAPATVDELKHEALQVAEDLLARFPQSAEAYHLMGLLQKALRQTDDAQQYWRKCLELAPDHTRARVGLARAIMDQGNDQMAAETLKEGLAAGYASPDLYATFATSLINLGKFDEAGELLNQGAAAFPEAPKIWMLLGQSQVQRGEFSQAETSLRKAIELAPRYTDAYYALATACARLGKREEAAEFRKRFGELRARDRELQDQRVMIPDLETMRERAAATLCGAGTVYLGSGDRAEGERLLLRAMAVDPEFSETYKALASLYQGEGEIADALVAVRRLIELEPENVVNYINAAGLSMRLGDTASAEQTLKQAIEARPDAAAAYSWLARLYLQTGRPEEARSLAQQALDRQATAPGYMLLASACERLDDRAGAEAAIAEAKKLTSGGPKREQSRETRP